MLLIVAWICLIIALAYYAVYAHGKYSERKVRKHKSDPKILAEDILKALFKQEQKGQKGNLSFLKGELGVDGQLIVSSLKTLDAAGVIVLAEDQFSLKAEGRKRAIALIRRHRIYEAYLAEETGYSKTDWHKKAEVMEHNLSPEEVEKMAQKLGYPRFDPHGDPIPSADGTWREMPGKPLVSMEVGDVARISHIEDEPEWVYKQIVDEKLHIDAPLEVLSKGQSWVIFSEGREHEISMEAAYNITVQEMNMGSLMDQRMLLSDLGHNEKAEIIGISSECRGANRRRLLDLGFVIGTPIRVSMDSPLGDPRAYYIRGTQIGLRKEQSDMILIKREKA